MTNKINKKYPHICNPLTIRNINLKNRLVFPAFSFNYAEDDGSVSQKLIEFYSELADHGPGLIITGGMVCTLKSLGFSHDIRIYNDNFIPGLKKLMRSIINYKAIPGIQLIAFGRQTIDPIKPVVAPSPLPCPVSSKLANELGIEYKIHQLSIKEIREIEEDFVSAAIRAEKAETSLIELNAAHGYLLNQFLSPYSNQRIDTYGGNILNRSRIIIEILEAIRAKINNDILISVRVSGNEFITNGLKPTDFKEIIPFFEKAGMDLLNVSVGVAETMHHLFAEIYSNGKQKKPGEAPYISIAAELKRFSSVPVCYCGYVSSIETAEKIISEGKADLVAIARAQVADPYLLKKTLEGMEKKIRHCLYDDCCLFFMTGDDITTCTINPKLKKSKK